MNKAPMIALLLVFVAVGAADEGYDDTNVAAELVRASPKLLRISGDICGSGRIVFTREHARYKHKHWGKPTHMNFDGEPWLRPERTPAAWREIVAGLDLSRAWIVKRDGRDAIALENTPDGFDLYLCDSPNGTATYAVTLAIPRRGRG